MGNEHSFQKTILYVDDQPSHRALFLKAFQGKYDIVTASSGEEGIEIIKKNRIALVIADHNMPGMTGIDFLEKVQEMEPKTEKAILSAYLDDGILKDLNRRVVKVTGQLAKPWKLEGMRGFIDKTLASFVQAAVAAVAAEGEVPDTIPSLPGHSDLRSELTEICDEIVSDKPLLSSQHIAHAAEHLASEGVDHRGARRIFLSFVEPKIKSVFPLIRKPCDPLIKLAQEQALSGDIQALEKTLGLYLQEEGLAAVLAEIAEPAKKIVH